MPNFAFWAFLVGFLLIFIVICIVFLIIWLKNRKIRNKAKLMIERGELNLNDTTSKKKEEISASGGGYRREHGTRERRHGERRRREPEQRHENYGRGHRERKSRLQQTAFDNAEDEREYQSRYEPEHEPEYESEHEPEYEPEYESEREPEYESERDDSKEYDTITKYRLQQLEERERELKKRISHIRGDKISQEQREFPIRTDKNDDTNRKTSERSNRKIKLFKPTDLRHESDEENGVKS